MCFPNVNKAGHTGSTATAVQVPRGGQQLQCVLCKGQGHQDTPPARHHPTRGNAQVCCVLWHVHVSSYSGVLCALARLRLRCVVCFGMSQTQVCCVLWHVSNSGVLCALACLRLRCVVCFGMCMCHHTQVCCVLWHVSDSGVLCALACLRLRCVVCFGMSQTQVCCVLWHLHVS